LVPDAPEAGVGLVGSLAGVTVFLSLLLFAAQVVLNLYATSAVTAAAFDAARVVAGGDGGPGFELAAEAHARRLLGRYGENVTFQWAYPDVDGDGAGDEVHLRVQARSAGRLLPRMDDRLPFASIERTVVVRAERVR